VQTLGRLPGQPQIQSPVQTSMQTPDQVPGATQIETLTGRSNAAQDQSGTSANAVRSQWPNLWVPAGSARIQALDKVNAQTSTLTMKVGQPATFGSLTITVKGCVVRPPDQPIDAAAYLDVTDSHADSPGFDGWMLANEPAVSMMQNPIYDLRVAGCS
jgi:hypothetical protein